MEPSPWNPIGLAALLLYLFSAPVSQIARGRAEAEEGTVKASPPGNADPLTRLEIPASTGSAESPRHVRISPAAASTGSVHFPGSFMRIKALYTLADHSRCGGGTRPSCSSASVALLQPPASAAPKPSVEVYHILLLSSQLVGWLRIACLAAALATPPAPAATLFLANFALDAADGLLARRRGEETAFGAVFDVLIDNASRSVLWASALDGPAGVAVPLLEMTTFACTHAASHLVEAKST